MSRISLDRIIQASKAVDPVFLNSPQFTLTSLNEELGCNLICKLETLNPIRSFKGRGADFYLSQLTAKPARPLRLVCASAGNFGQGLAYAARRRGVKVDVFSAQTANALKLEKMRQLGARVQLAGHDFDEAKDAAKAYALREQLPYVEDGFEPAISEGAGTIAVELLASPHRFDAIVVPLGNGALLSGIGTWMRAHSPATRVIGVCASGAPAMAESWRTGRLTQTNSVRTIADGIAVRVPIPAALQDLQPVLDDVWLVEDETILAAMRLALSEVGVLLEPAGAVGLAGICAHRDQLAGQTVATVFCGGNVTEEQRRRWFC